MSQTSDDKLEINGKNLWSLASHRQLSFKIRKALLLNQVLLKTDLVTKVAQTQNAEMCEKEELDAECIPSATEALKHLEFYIGLSVQRISSANNGVNTDNEELILYKSRSVYPSISPIQSIIILLFWDVEGSFHFNSQAPLSPCRSARENFIGLWSPPGSDLWSDTCIVEIPKNTTWNL